VFSALTTTPILTLVLILTSAVSAEEVNLRSAAHPAAPLPGFSEQVNRSTPFYLWQNDPLLIAGSGSPVGSAAVTGFCIPSTLTNLLARARVLNPDSAGNIPLNGLSSDGSKLEGAEAILGFMRDCEIDPSAPVDPLAASECTLRFLRAGGLSGERVHLIRRLGAHVPAPGLRYEDRPPTLTDILAAVRSGDETALTLAFMTWDPTLKAWKKSGSHMVNVTGYAYNPGENRILLHISNPTRRYRLDGVTPVFDTLQITPQDPGLPEPQPYAPLRATTVSGRLIEFDGKTTFVGGLIRVRISH
jgi:hypothetical protein